jgi:hypothetical protein
MKTMDSTPPVVTSIIVLPKILSSLSSQLFYKLLISTRLFVLLASTLDLASFFNLFVFFPMCSQNNLLTNA